MCVETVSLDRFHSNEEDLILVRYEKVRETVDGADGGEGQIEILTPEEVWSKDNGQVRCRHFV